MDRMNSIISENESLLTSGFHLHTHIYHLFICEIKFLYLLYRLPIDIHLQFFLVRYVKSISNA